MPIVLVEVRGLEPLTFALRTKSENDDKEIKTAKLPVKSTDNSDLPTIPKDDKKTPSASAVREAVGLLAISPDLARMALLWEQIPIAVRQAWLVAAEALTDRRADKEGK